MARPTMRPSVPEQGRLRVAIVTKNEETLHGLEAYLQRAGAKTIGTREIERAAEIVSDVAAVVVFPDDFEWSAVVPALVECMTSNRRALAVIVTNAPQRFEPLVWPQDAAPPLLVPKPAWGFTILDAIRAHMNEPTEPEGEA